MANTVMMFDVLGYAKDHPDAALARVAVEKLVVLGEREAYCQPCMSPVWDTGLACHALFEAGDESAMAATARGLQWLLPKQILDVKGDWAVARPHVRPGGWAFQYANPHYPDLDDTAVVVMAFDRMRKLQPTRQFDSRHRARPGMDRGTAEPRRRLGGVRCGQHLLLPQQHSVRGSWRAA